MVLEDDFYLTKNYIKAFRNIKNFCTKNDLLENAQPVLIRLGSHTIAEKDFSLNLKFLIKFYKK